MLSRPASVAPEQRTAAGTQGGPGSGCGPAPLLSAPPGRLLFPALTREAHALRPSLPAAGGGKRKGLLFSSLPFCRSPGC